MEEKLKEAFKIIDNNRFEIISVCGKCGKQFKDDCIKPGKRNVLDLGCRTKRNFELVSKIWNLTATAAEMIEFETNSN